MTHLAHGDGMPTHRRTRDPNYIAYYPRSNKIYFRGVGVMARLKRLDYWDGESDD